MTRTLVCIPTYDEIESLPPLLERLLAAQPDVDVLVVDDGSPDGTGRWAQQRADAEPRVHVLHRSGKQGLGAAYLAGFAWALERGYDVVCEMDADGSHAPEDLGRLLSAVQQGADLAIGSRWVAGGQVRNWPAGRRLLSRGGNTYTRVVLGIAVHDATAGFRAFTAEALRTIPLADVASAGYCFQVDLAWRASRAGLRVVEVPITFVEREAGASKMSSGIVREALWRVTVWGAAYRAGQLRGLLRRPRPSGAGPGAGRSTGRGPVRGADGAGSVCLGSGGAGQLALPQEREPLLQQDLELGDGPTLEEHVPVRPLRSRRLGFGTVRVPEQGLGPAPALPQRGHVCLHRERHDHGVAVGAVVGRWLPGRGLHVRIRLHAHASEPGTSQAASFSHHTPPSRGVAHPIGCATSATSLERLLDARCSAPTW